MEEHNAQMETDLYTKVAEFKAQVDSETQNNMDAFD